MIFRDSKAVSAMVEECTPDTTPTKIPTWTPPNDVEED